MCTDADVTRTGRYVPPRPAAPSSAVRLREPLALMPCLLMACATLAACEAEPLRNPAPVDDPGRPGAAAEARPGPPPDVGPPDVGPPDLGLPDMAVTDEGPPDDPCSRVASVVDDGRPRPVQWSAVHAMARFFGSHDGSAAVDAALVAAFADDPRGDAERYARALPFVCAVDAVSSGLGPATVELRGRQAWIRPGIGPVEVPEAAMVIVLDLVDLPADPALPEALEAAAAAVMPGPTAQIYLMRVFSGLPDELRPSDGPYYHGVGYRLSYWPGEAPITLPVAVRVGRRMAPAAARLALALRTKGVAWLVGETLYTDVAERAALPLGDRGLAIHWGRAGNRGDVPDHIPPDADTVEAWLGRYTGWAAPPLAGPDAPVNRLMPEPYDPLAQTPPATPGPAARRAMLIVAHGALRRFFPYFDGVGDDVDARLVEVWATLDDDGPWTRRDTVNLLRRFAEAIRDGHAFVSGGALPGLVAPIAVDHLEDETPVVRASRDFGVRPGHVITHIDGRPAAEWYAEELTRTSAATRGYALDRASRRYLQGRDPLRLGLMDLEGDTWDVALDRVAFGGAPSSTPWHHPTGWLDAFDAPGVYYVNLAHDVEQDVLDLLPRMQAALPDAEGLILDMRGYPGLPTLHVALLTIGGEAYRSAILEVPLWEGPAVAQMTHSQDDARVVAASALEVPPFAGPVALLVGPTSVSAAEDFAMTIAQSAAVTVVGRRSAGTNGNITGVKLPGGLGLTFTGMRVLFPDGARFHGVGIAPDVEVWPTAAALAEGRDAALDAAIEVTTR